MENVEMDELAVILLMFAIYGGLGIWRLLIVGGLDHIGFIQFSNVRDEEVLVNSTPYITNYEGMELNSSSIRG